MAKIIKNIEKRKQLQQMIYDNYGQLTEEEKKDLDMEVGSALQGYQKCLSDICQIIADGREDGETLKTIVKFITTQYNGRTTKGLFRISEVIPTEIQMLIRENMKKQIITSGLAGKPIGEEEAETICDSFVNYPAVRQSIIEKYGIQGFNMCPNCGKVFTYLPMTYKDQDGNISHFCSQGCILEHTGKSSNN